MIVRIMGHGQWVVQPEDLVELNPYDEAVERAVAREDQDELRDALVELIPAIKQRGTEVPDDVLAESDLVIPDVDATVEEVRDILDQTSEYYGLIPDSPEQAAAAAAHSDVAAQGEAGPEASESGELSAVGASDLGDAAPVDAAADEATYTPTRDNPA